MQNQTREIAEALRRNLHQVFMMTESTIAKPDPRTAEYAQNWVRFIWSHLQLLACDSHVSQGSQSLLRAYAQTWERFTKLWCRPNYSALSRTLTAFDGQKASLQAVLCEILKSSE